MGIHMTTQAAGPESWHMHLPVMTTLGLYSCSGHPNWPLAELVMQLRKDQASNLEDYVTYILNPFGMNVING